MPPTGGIEEAVAEADEGREREQRGEAQVPRRVDGGERRDRAEAGDVGDDHQGAARVAVGERPADQQRGEERHRLAEEDEAEARRAGEGQGAPAEGASPTSETA
jgi:hypothetical protein